MRSSDTEYAVLFTKGQPVIPEKGCQKLMIMGLGDEVVIRSEGCVEETVLGQVAGMLEYAGERKSVEDIREGMAKAVREREI